MAKGKDGTMSLKLIGAMFIVFGCSGAGFTLAANHRKMESAFCQLIAALDYMECELQYHMTPLPELCRQTSGAVSGIVGKVFGQLAEELNRQISPEVRSCMDVSVANFRDLPEQVGLILRELGKTLGRFDLPGQLRGIGSARRNCRRALEQLERNRELRLRSYQTLGVCAGAALAILLM